MIKPSLRVPLMIVPLMGLLAAACGDDPTATPTATSAPTATPVQYLPTLGPIPTRTPTPTPTPVPPGEPVTYVIGRWQMEDGLFQLRMGDLTAWGYNANERISATDGDGVVITINLGDTITFTELNASSSRSSKPHHFTIDELGIDEERQPSQDAGFSFTPDKVGEFRIYDSEDPDGHGKAVLVVRQPTSTVTYVVGRWQMEDGLFQLRMGDLVAWGYNSGDRISATDGDGIVMTINLGDTITFTELNASSSRSSKPHHFTIAELGIDEERQPRQDAEFSFTPAKAGEFRIYDSEDPDAHGKAILIVK